MGISFVEYIEPYRVADGVRGEAYERVGALKRSRLKQTIAWNSAVVGVPGGRALSRVGLRQGGEHIVSTTPCDWTLVLVGNGFADPTAVLAAAVFPALVGVRDVVVIREDGNLLLPDSILTGLELAGLEDFGECGPTGLVEAIRLSATTSGNGAVLALGSFSPQVEQALCEAGTASCRLGRSGGVRTVHVLLDEQVGWDWESLAWAFPGAEYVFAGNGADRALALLPEGVAGRVCSEEELCSRQCDLFLHPNPVQPEALPAPICLGPGQEGVWVWAQLHRAMFRYTALRISS